MSIPPTQDGRAQLSLDALRDDGQWLVRLARAMGADSAAADDAAQSALIRGWRERAMGRPAPRAWLRTVMVSALRREQRGEGRRVRREKLAAHPERLEDPGGMDALGRLELQRAAIDALTRLDEPYRSTLVARFLEGLTATEIAKRQGAPVKTIQTRLRRGLERVREDLARSGNEGGPEWLAGLAWLARHDGAQSLKAASAAALDVGAKGAAGALIVSTGTKLAVSAAAVVIALGGAIFLRDVGTGRALDEPRTLAASTEGGPDLEHLTGALPPGDATGREAVRQTEPPTQPSVAEESNPAPEASGTRSGVVTAPDGTPMGDFALEVLDPSGEPAASVATGPDGTFALPGDLNGRLQAGEEHFTLVFDFALVNQEPRELHLTAIPAARLAGMVVDEAGDAVDEAKLMVLLETSVLMQSTSGERLAEKPDWIAVTAADGSFSLPRVPCEDSSKLRVTAPGFAEAFLSVPENGDLGMVIQLTRSEIAEHAVTGVVLNADGAAIEGAWVCAGKGGASVRTDAGGRFVATYDPDVTGDPMRVRALASGYLPAEQTRLRSERGPVTLKIDRRALGLSGTITEPGGDPVTEAGVWLSGKEHFGELEQNGGGTTFLLPMDYETMMASGSVPLGAWWLEDDGQFAIEGLRDVPYTIHAVDRRTLRMVTIPDVAAGTHGVVIALPPATATRTLEGLVVDGLGTPVPGITVRVELLHGTDNLRVRIGPTSKSDEEGRFRFEGLVPTNVRLTAWSYEDEVQPDTVDLGPDDDWSGQNLVVLRTLRARFACADPRFADGMLSLLDENGAELRMSIRVSNRTYMPHTTALNGGRSSVVILDDRARVARLTSGGGATIEVPLDLEPDVINEVELR